MNQLESNNRDRLLSVAKGAAGALPFVGTMVSEILDTVVPNLRLERVINFLKALDERVGDLDEKLEIFQKNIQTEQGLDIFEEGIVQASRAVTDDRKERLARLVEKSLTSAEVKYEESKKIINIYRELTDPEVIWLVYYSLHPVLGGGPHSDWMESHKEILYPISTDLSCSTEEIEKEALQNSYKETLLRYGLTEKKNNSISLTVLGRLLIKYISDGD